jgi:hypothetical protein
VSVPGNGDLSIGLYTKEQQGVFQQLEQKYGRMDLRKDEVNLEIYNKKKRGKARKHMFEKRESNMVFAGGRKSGKPRTVTRGTIYERDLKK